VRAYVLINASAGKAIDVARSLQGVTGIQHADAITGEYDVIAQVEAPDVAGIGTIIVDKIQKIDGVFKTCLLYTSPSPRDLSTSRMPSSA